MYKKILFTLFITLSIAFWALFTLFQIKNNKKFQKISDKSSVVSQQIVYPGASEAALKETNYLIEDLSKYLLARIDYLESRNSEIQATVLNDPKLTKISKERICKNIIEENSELFEIAKGYDCLAKVLYEKKDLVSVLRAIKYESMALEAFYAPEYLQNLLSFISENQSPRISWEFDEISYLNKLTNSNDKLTSAKAYYRLSLIKSLGRKSSLENVKYDLKGASELKSQVFDIIKIPADEKRKVDVLFSLNNNIDYVKYAKTTLASILLNADLDSEYRFYIVMDSEDEISEENKKMLESLHHLGSYSIQFITLPEGILDHKEDAFSSIRVRVSFQKFLMENVLRNIDKVITLDVDLIVLRDLFDLQNQDNFDNFVFAGASEPVRYGRNRLCDMTYDYVNTGVVVQNLKLMREINNFKFMLDRYKEEFKIRDKACFAYRDQDALNIVYKNRFKPISRRWNSIQIGWNDLPLSVDMYPPVMPFIIHFPGAKPSKNNLNRPENVIYSEYENLAFSN